MRSKRWAFALFVSFVATLAAGRAVAAEPSPAPTLRVFVVRHAQAWKNVPSLLRPKPMSTEELDALTPKGLARAEELGNSLAGHAVVAVYTSPARRAQQTAAAIAKALGLGAPIVSESFRTLDTGSDPNAASGSARMKNWKAKKDPRPTGGESLADGNARASTAIVELTTKHAGHAIVIVTHGEIASSLLTKAAGKDLLAGYFDHFPDEGSIHEIQVP
jgi:probable phosphoglycerate mutase